MFGLLHSLALLPVLVHAGPYPQPTPAVAELDKRAVNCNAVNLALSALKILGAPATSFCSSYISVPATTTMTVNGGFLQYVFLNPRAP